MKVSTGGSRHNYSELVFVIVLFLLFSLSALALVILGGNVYSGVLDRMDENYALRTPLAYVATKVRQGDARGAIRLDDALGTTALVLTEDAGGESYETWIYYYDGALREYYVSQGLQFLPAEGMEVVETAGFTIEQEDDGLLRFTCTAADGGQTELAVLPRASRP